MKKYSIKIETIPGKSDLALKASFGGYEISWIVNKTDTFPEFVAVLEATINQLYKQTRKK